METRNIFIDASIFIGKNYNYRSTDFEQLYRLARLGQAKVFLTDITVREVEAHIETDISKAIQALKKFQKGLEKFHNDARVLKNIDYSLFKELFQEINETKSTEILKCQLSTFLNEISATVLPTSDVSIKVVFDKYFGKRPPFGEGKKKSEFPDAFAIVAIQAWCKKNNEKMYVVSTDRDLKEYCETSDCLIALNQLAEFINVIELHDKELALSVNELLNKNQDAIKKAIAESFCKQDFWIENQEGDVDGDVENVRVNELEVYEMLILEVEEDAAVVHVEVGTNFSADLTYDGIDTTAYDSEDRGLFSWRRIEKTVDQDVGYTAMVQVLHDVEDSEYFEVDWVEIDSGFISRFLRSGFAVHSDNE